MGMCVRLAGRVSGFLPALVVGLGLLTGGAAMGGPALERPVPLPDADDFRFILVGDSQMTTPNAARVNSQMHRWDVRFTGELLTVGNSRVGHSVINSNAGLSTLAFTWIEPDLGWQDGGPHDFFNSLGARWVCFGDVVGLGYRIGWYKLNFTSGNDQAPWLEPWGRGVDLVARIAVRTSPHGVARIETRPERGGVPANGMATVHQLDQDWGIQIIEQPIPASINPAALDPGVGLYFPAGQVEKSGQTLEVLGVAIMVPDSDSSPAGGVFSVPHGRGGWATSDHLSRVSQQSREALIRISGADHLVTMLGHNAEDGGIANFASNFGDLMDLWMDAFTAEGRRLRSVVVIAPWAYGEKSTIAYVREVENASRAWAGVQRRASVFSYFSLYQGLPPPVIDPDRYYFDGGGHPGDIATARAFAEDLFCGLFPGHSSGCWAPPERTGAASHRGGWPDKSGRRIRLKD